MYADQTLEHIVDHLYGGSNDLDNLVLAHERCNQYACGLAPSAKRALIEAAKLAPVPQSLGAQGNPGATSNPAVGERR